MTVWRIGMKAVCIVKNRTQWYALNDDENSMPPKAPVYRKIYTVVYVNKMENSDRSFLTLKELSNSVWESSGFRPLVKRKTDISAFKKMLTDPPIKPIEEYYKEELKKLLEV